MGTSPILPTPGLHLSQLPGCDFFSSLKHTWHLLQVTIFHLTNFWGDAPEPLRVSQAQGVGQGLLLLVTFVY